MAQVINKINEAVDFDATVMLMDDEIREMINEELAPCTEQEFFEAYAQAHEDKYNEEFAPYAGLAW